MKALSKKLLLPLLLGMTTLAEPIAEPTSGHLSDNPVTGYGPMGNTPKGRAPGTRLQQAANRRLRNRRRNRIARQSRATNRT